MKKTKFILFLAILLSVALLITVPGCRQKKAETKKTKDIKAKIPAFYFVGEDTNDYFDESAEEVNETSDEFDGYDPEEAPKSMRRLMIYSPDNEQPQELQQESAYGELSEQIDDTNTESESDYYDEYEEDAEEEYEGQVEQHKEDVEDSEDYEEEYPDEDFGAEPNGY